MAVRQHHTAASLLPMAFEQDVLVYFRRVGTWISDEKTSPVNAGDRKVEQTWSWREVGNGEIHAVSDWYLCIVIFQTAASPPRLKVGAGFLISTT